MNWNAIFTEIGTNVTALVVVAWLARVLVKHFLDKDVSKFQSTLERQAERSIENYRSSLEKERIRLQISYSGIFEKQATATLEIYRSIVALERVASEAVHFGGTKAERRQKFGEALAATNKQYVDSRILLPEVIDSKISHLMDRMFKGVLDYTSADDRSIVRMSDEQLDKLYAKQDKAAEVIADEVPKIKEELINQMRTTLGVVPT